ncbi:MAG TPA: long-chain fatty acid--CoA ligase [Vicinamibacterales bacterium]|nr:long-chain fatty acid--CoA ligase [Vicinamibacterales bacterium]
MIQGETMQGLMMDYPLTLSAVFRRAEALFGSQELVARNVDKSIHRYTYADWAKRARRLASAFESLGLKSGDRIATLAWNHGPHLEAYFAIPLMGGVLHTLNLRLHPDELAYIVNHAEDRAVVVDPSLLPLWEKVRPLLTSKVIEIINGDPTSPGAAPDALEYEKVVASAKPIPDRPDVDERSAAAMCYTTGTTGAPKGVVYSHRSTVIHTMAQSMKSCMGIGEEDTLMPVVPMFHANAWGMPFAAILNGAKIVNPGPHLDPASLLDLFVTERPTIVGGVPTIWIAVQQLMEQNPGKYDLTSIRAMYVGGSAVPQSLIESYEKKFGLRIIQAWGMTEMSPLGTVGHEPPRARFANDDERFKYRAKQGRPAPFVDIRARSEDGIVPWDGQTMGELEVRGPWISSAYYNRPDAADRFTDDGWFKTGDIVTIDKSGTIQVQDRSKDVIKSGGEWISSVALECALMGHPAVAEAAVISVEHPKWAERPLAAVVLKPGQTASPSELKSFLAPQFPKFWLPDAFEFVEAIPRTSAGKFKKSELRKQFKDYRLAE